MSHGNSCRLKHLSRAQVSYKRETRDNIKNIFHIYVLGESQAPHRLSEEKGCKEREIWVLKKTAKREKHILNLRHFWSKFFILWYCPAAPWYPRKRGVFLVKILYPSLFRWGSIVPISRGALLPAFYDHPQKEKKWKSTVSDKKLSQRRIKKRVSKKPKTFLRKTLPWTFLSFTHSLRHGHSRV